MSKVNEVTVFSDGDKVVVVFGRNGKERFHDGVSRGSLIGLSRVIRVGILSGQVVVRPFSCGLGWVAVEA